MTEGIDARRTPIVRLTDKNEAMADSRDVAEYFGKEHRRVLQTIRELHCSPDFRRRNFVPFKINDLTGESTSHVTMTKDGFTFLAMGFTGAAAGLFKEKYITAYNELEAELRNRPEDPTRPHFHIPQTLPEALRLAADLSEKVEAQNRQIEASKPKTIFFDKFVEADGLYGYMNGGRALACHPTLFVRWLKRGYVFYEGACLLPYLKWREMGLFEIKVEVGSDGKSRPRGYITPKGIEYLSSRVPAEIKIQDAA